MAIWYILNETDYHEQTLTYFITGTDGAGAQGCNGCL